MEGHLQEPRVSRLCGEIDERVQTFLSRPIEGEWPYVCWMPPTSKPDATATSSRSRSSSPSASTTDGRREVLGMTVGHSEAEPFWVEFLRSLARRGLRGAKLVISDAHEGLKAAIVKVLGATLAALPRTLHGATRLPMPQDPTAHRLRLGRPPPSPRTTRRRRESNGARSPTKPGRGFPNSRR